MFGFKKKDGDVPPDVGQEEKYDAENASSGDAVVSDDRLNAPVMSAPANISSSPSVGSSIVPVGNFQIERVSARVDSIVEWIKQFYERFSYISESIGEIRSMNIENEKKISLAMKDADMVIDIVKEVKPENLRMDYQKIDMKVAALSEKIEANKQFMAEIMAEMNDLRRKSEVFIGTEGLMKLNEDTKKDLVELQKLAAKTKMQADKGQEIFMEIRKGFAEAQKVAAIVSGLDESYSGVMETIEKLKVDHGKVVKYSDYLDFKNNYGNKIAAFESEISRVEDLSKNVEELGSLVETSLSAARRNEEDIGKLGLKIGSDDVKSVEDYENQMVEVVGIVDRLASQIADIREHLGMESVEGKIAEAKEKLGMETTGSVVKKTVNPVTKKVVKKVAMSIVRPSESESVVSAVKRVRLPDIPVLKPKEFLGRENILQKRMQADIDEVRASSEEEPFEEADVFSSDKIVD
jgi:hypothetical protein